MPLTPDEMQQALADQQKIFDELSDDKGDFQRWCKDRLGDTCAVSKTVVVESGSNVPVVTINPTQPLDEVTPAPPP